MEVLPHTSAGTEARPVAGKGRAFLRGGSAAVVLMVAEAISSLRIFVLIASCHNLFRSAEISTVGRDLHLLTGVKLVLQFYT